MTGLKYTARKMPGRGMESCIDSELEELPFSEIDLHVHGIVRWLNEFGIYTTYSCDGHDCRPAEIMTKSPISRQDLDMLKACAGSAITIKQEGRKLQFRYPQGKIHLLLDCSERLYHVWQSPEKLHDYKAKLLMPKVKELLRISAASGDEHAVRRQLVTKLIPLVDDHYRDRAGNLLATLHCGEGPTILLSAHMDTFEAFHPDRTIQTDGTILTNSSGILGGDDRAGIAVILETLDRAPKTNFCGTLKVALTVKEEIGCQGALQIDPDFIQDIDAAIVVDRRNTRDIVTSCGSTPFCDDAYGQLFEQAGVLAGMDDWCTTPGGSSDARIFAEYGIPSVNLSVGYNHEHTSDEYLDIKAMYETCLLIESLLHHQLIK